MGGGHLSLTQRANSPSKPTIKRMKKYTGTERVSREGARMKM